MHLGTLAGGLGCFPLDRETHLPRSDCRYSDAGIRSLVGLGNQEGPQDHPVLYLQHPLATLALKLFRGEQAIS